jgi:thiol-disulfide isomerase/thioredoxin
MAMGTASRTRRAGTARERIAAQRAAARRTEVRSRVFLASGAVVVVIAIVVAFVLVKANAKPAAGRVSNGLTGAALATVVNKTTGVPASTLDKVGAGTVTGGLTSVSGPPLTAKGKPEVLYIGAEYCPFCAAQRWVMIVALSRFGTFSGLHTIHSASRDKYPNTPTFTFAGSHYASKYVSFAPVEETTNVPNGPNSYTQLQKPTAAQQALASKYDSHGSIPFIDFGNKYVQVGTNPGYGPQDLAGKTWAQIAAALHDPSSPTAKAVGGAANWTTAAICKLTNNQPASACTPAVKALEAKL